jgi:hypothetical protein
MKFSSSNRSIEEIALDPYVIAGAKRAKTIDFRSPSVVWKRH